MTTNQDSFLELKCYWHIRLPYLSRLHKCFSYFAVAAAIAGSDEVSDTAALQEGCRGHGPSSAENAGECNHLHQAQTDHCCFSIVPESQTITETCPDRNNVLKDRRKSKQEDEMARAGNFELERRLVIKFLK